MRTHAQTHWHTHAYVHAPSCGTLTVTSCAPVFPCCADQSYWQPSNHLRWLCVLQCRHVSHRCAVLAPLCCRRIPKFSPYGEMRMLALKGLACRKRVAAAIVARLPQPASKVRRSRRLRDTLAAAPGLLAHASVTETGKFCPMG